LIRPLNLRNRTRRLARLLSHDDRAAQLVEFAVALPLLMVFVVGIFDFSGAFTLKQKLTNTARDAARAAASEPATDIASPGSDPIPASVDDAIQLIKGYLATNNLNDCGLSSSSYVNGPGPIWTFTASVASPPCAITVIVNRGYFFPVGGAAQTAPANCRPASASATQIEVVSTCVSIQYSYQWRFGRVASLLGASTALPTNLTAISVAMNEN
jgi:Flp pilus assembly protein TadG